MISRESTFERAAWMTELRATLALGWPLVLATIAQNALITSDVILMGWMGSDALAAGALPRHHDDPFDRALIAQASIESLTVVTRDERFDAYGVDLLLA